MNPTLRWNLILGCAVVAALELPHDARVLAQDLRGPWGTTSGVGESAARSWESAAQSMELDGVAGGDIPATYLDLEVSDAGVGDDNR